MRIYFFLICLISINCSLLAQNISVQAFHALPQDLNARVDFPVIDQNGDKAALIKIVTTETGFKFEGGMLGIVKAEQKTGEVWVYVPHGSRKITIKHARLGVLRNYLFPENIKEACVYEMILVSGKVTTIVEETPIAAQWLVVQSVPEGAVVMIDGKELGQTPFSRKIKEGNYNYRIEYPRYHSEIGKLEINGDKTQLNFNLNPKFGALSVNSFPEHGMSVFLDDRNTGMKTPVVLNDIDSGEHELSLHSKWYQNQAVSVDVFDMDTAVVEFELEPAFASVVVNSTDDSEIFIDGNKYAESRWSGRLLEGVYELVIRKPSHKEIVKQLDLHAGVNVSLDLPLSPETGSVDVISIPIGAKIFIDGQAHGTTPNTVEKLLCGKHQIVIEYNGFASLSKEFIVEKNKTIVLDEKLKDGESVVIESIPTGVNVYVDEIYKGKTPLELSMGYDSYYLRMERGENIRRVEIQISPNGKLDFSYDMRTLEEKRDDKAWEVAIRNNSVGAYEYYLSYYRNGLHSIEAAKNLQEPKFKEDERFYKKCLSSNLLSDYELYLEQYPNGKYIEEVNQVLERSYYDYGNEAYHKKEYNEAVSYYSKYLNNFNKGENSAEVLQKMNRAIRRRSRNDSGFFIYAYDVEAPIGFSLGSLIIDNLGFYLNFRSNSAFWQYEMGMDLDAEYEVSELDNIWAGTAVPKYEYSYSRYGFSLGLDYKLAYPIWLYAGVGINSKTRYDQYDFSGDIVWAKNNSFSGWLFNGEVGTFVRVGDNWLVKYGLFFSESRTIQQFGLGYTF